MEFSADYIEELTGKEIAGIISADEKVSLYELIKNDERAHAIWKKKHEFYNDPEIQKWQNDYHSGSTLITIRKKVRKRRRLAYIGAATTIAAMIVISIGIHLHFKNDKTSDLAAGNTTVQHAVELKTENGETLNLSEVQGQVTLNDQVLQNMEKTLSVPSSLNSREVALLTIPPGENYKVILPDNSAIWLNSATTLQFSFNFSEHREITVNGEAYLEVVKNDRVPFIVHTPNGTVRVLGTSFNINTYDTEKVRVALVEGSVKFNTNTDSILLTPGTEAITLKHGISSQPFHAEEVLSWKEGIYRFNDIPLSELLEIIPRWFRIQVKLDDPKLGQRHFTGRIDRDRPLTQSLDVLKGLNGIDYYFDDEGALHFK